MTTLPSNPAPIPNRRRSQRVFLRLPVLVIARGPDGQHVSENAFTTNVNAHGALLLMSMRVEVGQKILFRNTETLEEQFVKVIHVTSAAEGKTEVGVEFLKPAPKFWRISFPPTTGPPKTPKSPPTPFNCTIHSQVPRLSSRPERPGLFCRAVFGRAGLRSGGTVATRKPHRHHGDHRPSLPPARCYLFAARLRPLTDYLFPITDYFPPRI